MVRPGTKASAVFLTGAAICEIMKMAEHWEMGAFEFYSTFKDIWQDVIRMVPQWLHDWMMNTINRAKNKALEEARRLYNTTRQWLNNSHNGGGNTAVQNLPQ